MTITKSVTFRKLEQSEEIREGDYFSLDGGKHLVQTDNVGGCIPEWFGDERTWWRLERVD